MNATYPPKIKHLPTPLYLDQHSDSKLIFFMHACVCVTNFLTDWLQKKEMVWIILLYYQTTWYIITELQETNHKKKTTNILKSIDNAGKCLAYNRCLYCYTCNDHS